MPKINPENTDVTIGTTYPQPLDEPCKTRMSRRLSNAGGLTQFGVNHVTLPPGCWASQRHHHSAEDEFVYILSGKPTLIDDDGETPLSPVIAARILRGTATDITLSTKHRMTSHF